MIFTDDKYVHLDTHVYCFLYYNPRLYIIFI